MKKYFINSMIIEHYLYSSLTQNDAKFSEFRGELLQEKRLNAANYLFSSHSPLSLHLLHLICHKKRCGDFL